MSAPPFLRFVKKSTFCSAGMRMSIYSIRYYHNNLAHFDKNTNNDSNSGGIGFSALQGDPGTMKLARWLDVSIIKRQGRAFDASKSLMSHTDEDSIIFPR
jgi:hypothetical protein